MHGDVPQHSSRRLFSVPLVAHPHVLSPNYFRRCTSVFPPKQAWDTFRPRTNADIPVPPGAPECRELVFLKATCLEDEGTAQTISGRVEHDEITAAPADHASADSEVRPVQDRAEIPAHEKTGTFQPRNKSNFGEYRREEQQPLVVPSVHCPTVGNRGRNYHTPPAGVRAKKVPVVQTLPKTVPDGSGLNVEGQGGNNTGQAVGKGCTEPSFVVASLRAGDWVLLERNSSISGGSCAIRSEGITGWLRIEAVSVG